MGWWKLLADVVSWLWTSKFFINKCLLFTTYKKRENIYWERKGKISSVLNNSLHESIFFELVVILKYFLHSEYSNTIRGVTPKSYAVGYDRTCIKNITFLKLSLTILLQLLLHNMQSSIWKLIGQYNYRKLQCHQPLNPENLYMQH